MASDTNDPGLGGAGGGTGAASGGSSTWGHTGLEVEHRQPPPRRREDSEPPPEEHREKPNVNDVFSITSDALPTEALLLAFSGAESLSTPYRFDLTILMPIRASQNFDMVAALGQRASIAVHKQAGETRWGTHGVFASVELDTENARGSVYRATLVPKFFLLSQSHHSRVWVDKKIPDILEEVLKSYGLASGDDYELRLSGTYAVRDHVCQYKESDLDFVSRWMESEGIYYFFEQSGEHEKLVLVDDKSAHERSGGSVRYFPTAGADASAAECFQSFTCRHAALPKSVKLRDYDYLHPSMDVSGQSDAASNGAGEVVVSGADHFLTAREGARLAKIRAQEIAARKVTFTGRGRVYELRPGFLFDVEDHPRSEYNASYLAVSVEHSADMQLGEGGLRGSDQAGGTYSARVRAIPEDTQFRPARVTRRPAIEGFELAIVDGEQDHDYAQIDEHGRYRVKIKFDENEHSAGQASTWVRMMQPHAGEPEGMHFPLRKNTEVLLAFEAGDPDRPVIAGAIAEAVNQNVVTQDNHMHNVIHTGGDSRVELSDDASKRYGVVSTPPQKTFIHVGAHRDATAFAGEAQHNSVVSTDGTGLLNTGSHLDVFVDLKKTEEVDKSVTETYCATHTTRVTLAVTEKYHADLSTTVTSHCQEEYGLQSTTTHGATEEKSGSQDTKVSAILIESHGSQKVEVEEKLTEKSAIHLSNFGPSTQKVGSAKIVSGGIVLWNTMGALTATVSGEFVIQTPLMAVIGNSITTAKAKEEETSATELDLTMAKVSTIGTTTATIGAKIELYQLSAGVAGLKMSRGGIAIGIASAKKVLFPGVSLVVCGIKISPNAVEKDG